MAIIKVELLKLGRRIKASRKILGRRQKDFCERCGLERSHFDEIERGERNVTFSNLCQICEGLDCDIATVTEGIPHVKSASKQRTEEQPKHPNFLVSTWDPISYPGGLFAGGILLSASGAEETENMARLTKLLQEAIDDIVHEAEAYQRF